MIKKLMLTSNISRFLILLTKNPIQKHF